MNRIVITLASVFPYGFLMGIPFPSEVSILKKTSKDHVPWTWCLNCVFSPLGSFISVALAMFHGFNSVSLLGAFIYFTIFLIGFKAKGLEVTRSWGFD